MSEYIDTDLAEEAGYFEEDMTERITRRDGWIAALLLGAVIFGPRTHPGSALPPMRFVDLILLFLVMTRWLKAKRLYGGFWFSYRIKTFSIFMPFLAFVVLASTFLNVFNGRNPLIVQDLYSPIVILRMVLIAAITASFNLQEKQVRQFAKGFLVISSLVAALALVQKFQPYLVSGIIERFYAIEYQRLEISTAGTGSRVVGTFGNPNMFSSCLVSLSAGALAIVINMKGLTKYFAVGVFFALAFTILITTGSRTGYLSFIMITVFAILFSLRGRSLVPAIVVLIFMVLAFVLIRANVDSLPLNPRMKQLVGGDTSLNDSMAARYRLWRNSIAKAKESPLLGVGVAKSYYQVTDNGYIMMLLRAGLLGLSIYVLMLLSLMWKGVRGLYYETNAIKKTVVLIPVLVLINHMIFEMTADFFWSVQLGELFALFAGMLCGMGGQALVDHNYNQQQNYYDMLDEGVPA